MNEDSPRVAAVLVVHGADPYLDDAVRAVAGEVDEFVVVANLPELPGSLPDGAMVLRNPRPVGFAANVNQAILATTTEYVVLVNPDAVATSGAVTALVEFAETKPTGGVFAPMLVYPDGTWQPSRRRFPTVAGTLVRRTPLRLLFRPDRFSRAHYNLDTTPPAEPARSDWMLGAFWLLRRTMLDEIGWFDEGFRLYGEDIDLCYRASLAGWDRWYVPQVQVQHVHNAVTDRRFFTRRTMWHWAGIVRFARKHPELLHS